MAGVAAAPPANDRMWRRRLRPLIGFLTVLVLLLVVWEVAQGARRRALEDRLAVRDRARDRLGAAVQVRLRDGREAAPHLGHRDGVLRRRRQRPDDARPPARRGALHAPERGDRVRPRVAPGHVAGDRAGARPAARALGRADHRGQPDHPDHRHRAAHRHRAQGRLVRRRDRVDLPDVLPGHDRRAPRPARVRPPGARADALVRGVARRDPAQAAPARPRGRTCSPGSASRRRPRSSAPSSASCRR